MTIIPPATQDDRGDPSMPEAMYLPEAAGSPADSDIRPDSVQPAGVADTAQTGYLFIGERRSPTAVRRGWTWESGRLCADTLFRALRALGLDPADCRFGNAYTDDGEVDIDTLMGVASIAVRGTVVVALGQRASRALDAHFIPHRRLIHPAARGAIRRTDLYQAHVRDVLGRR